jgi:predicted amino acid racemase
VFNVVEHTLKLEHIKLEGIGTNLTCYGGVLPTPETLEKLVECKNKIQEKFNIKLNIVSGGNSSTIEMLLDDSIPYGINNLRLGESIVLGRETAYGMGIDNLYNDVFTLEAEIIEIKEKPSIPIGTIGMNAFGKVPVFEDKGNMLRAIIALGKQDVDHLELIPYDTIKAIGSSSDHIILDISDSYNIYQIGDPVLFKLTYASVLSLMTSKYVKKVFI